MTTHQHQTKFGPPYDWNAPVTCPACKEELREALINNYQFFCAKYGTEPDLRNIADLLAQYE